MSTVKVEQVLLNSTITSNGSYVFRAGPAGEVVLVYNITGAVTGTAPILQFTLSEIDPSNETTVIDKVVASAEITATGTSGAVTLLLSITPTVLVSWTVAGSSPSFGGVNLVVFSKDAGVSQADAEGGSYPDPKNLDIRVPAPLLVDSGGSLRTRGPILTDEGSFRDNFISSLTLPLSGTVTFTSGSTYVNGIGSLFARQLDTQQYIKRTVDPDSAWTLVRSISNDTQLELVSPYPGTTGNGGIYSQWMLMSSSGGSIANVNSNMTLSNSLGNGAIVAANRFVDYGPLVINTRVACTSRVPNQTPWFGLVEIVDVPLSASGQRAVVIFDPTLGNTQVVFRTAAGNNVTQSTTVTLPGSALTTAINQYLITTTGATVTLSINGVTVAQHTNAIPDNYVPLNVSFQVENAAVVGASAVLTSNAMWVNDLNRIEVANSFPGEPLFVRLTGVASGSMVPQPIAGRYVPQYGPSGVVLPITLSSLGSSAARQSAAVDNTVSLYEDVLLFIKFTTATTAVSTTGYVNVYGYGTVDGVTYPEGLSGVDGAATLSTPPNLVLLAQLTANANLKTYTAGPISFCRNYGVDRLPAKWGIVIVNQSGAALNATGSYGVTYQGVNGQLT